MKKNIHGIDGAILTAARLAVADIALVADASQAILYASESFTGMSGYTAEEVLGRDCRLLQGPGTSPAIVAEMHRALTAGETFEGEILNYRKDGSAFWNALKIVPLRLESDSVTHFVSVQQDISNRIAMVEQLKYQALHDQLTGLPNRASGKHVVEEAVTIASQRERTVGVGLIDLDDFRAINNLHGHAVGDSVLLQWSTRIQSRLRDSDFLARMGGDEFLVVVRDLDRERVQAELPGILDRLYEAVEEPFTAAGEHVRMSMSMGLALVPEDGIDSRTILRHADEALYSVKAQGRSRRDWWSSWQQAAAAPTYPDPDANSKAEVEGDIAEEDRAGAPVAPNAYRWALHEGGALIELQPVINLQDGSLHSFEALARLKLPNRALAYPGEFLPHLKEADHQVLFSDVLDQALEFLAESDHAVDMSINLEPALLKDPNTLRAVEQSLKNKDIAPYRLTLELLESESLGHEIQRSALQDIVDLGVGLAMDDLGSGYSSLQRLASYPFNTLKLDRGLLSNAYRKPLDTLSVMATLIQMGRDLGMKVVIEGLEDENLTEAAFMLGAPLGQGYFFAKPMPVSTARNWAEQFTFDMHRAPIRAPLGALAYHWQFARLGTAHPQELDQCRLTTFLASSAGSQDVRDWHARQHTEQGVHPPSSRLLINWLTQQIQAQHPERSSSVAAQDMDLTLEPIAPLIM